MAEEGGVARKFATQPLKTWSMLGVTTHAWAQIQPTNVEEGLSAGSANYLNNQ